MIEMGMLNNWQRRLRFHGRRAGLPLALLLLALAGLFLLSHDRAYFYRGGWHDRNSAKVLAFAENLSFAHNLLIFHYQSRDADGAVAYPFPYNRFPLGGYVLVKLAILPFGDTDYTAKIYAARALMLALFSAAILLAYHALARVTGSRWDALAATLLAFATYYVLYYSDKISNEVTTEIFAAMLAVHGMSVFICAGRFRQLVVKSCLALLLGWHVYAFLLPFIVFGLAGELLKARPDGIAPTVPVLDNLKRYAAVLRRSRYLLLGIITLLFGIAVLTFNFSNEYLALKGTVPLRELPSVSSAVARLGGDAAANARRAERLQPERFWPDQFYRIAVMTLPHAVRPYEIKGRLPPYRPADYPAIAAGVLALGVCLAGLVAVRRRPRLLLLLGTLTAAGFCWAVPVRHNVASHDFESVFYIGIPLVAFTLALLGARRVSRRRLSLSPYFAVAALIGFILSASALAGVGQSRAELTVEAQQMADYAAIRELADDRRAIYVPWPYLVFSHGGARWASAYFLAGQTLIYTDGIDADQPWRDGDYLLLLTRADGPALLTPDNRDVFLYDRTLYDQQQRTAHRGRPVIAADWQVYLSDGRLTYTAPECVNRDEMFFLHFTPRNAVDLPADRQSYGYDNADFVFGWGGVTLSDGACVIERPLPDYDIAAIRTGQHNAAGRIWQGEYRLPAP